MKTMLTKAFHNDKVDGRILKAFVNIKKLLRKGDNTRKRTVSIAEFNGLVEHAPAEFKPVLEMAFYTGMRAGEIQALEWSYYDKYAGVLRLPAEITKENKAKIIPLISKAKAVLSVITRCVHHDHVFSSAANAPFHKWAFVVLMEETCVSAEIPYGRKKERGMTFHDIRRTVKTNMLEAGIDKTYRDLILGHSLQGMDAHYISPDEKILIREMTKYVKWLEVISENVTQSVIHGQ